MKIELKREELEDIISALSYFIDNYEDRKGSVQTRRAMVVILAKLWREIKKEKVK